MKKQSNESNSFFETLKDIYSALDACNFESALQKCSILPSMNTDEMLQLNSLKAFLLINLGQFQQAGQLLESCLEEKPLHLASLKRKASLLQKMGKIEEAKENFQLTLYLEPESRSLKNKLKKLKMKSSHASHKSEDSSDSKESKESKEHEQKKEKPVVKFGSFEVIDITTEDSDEHFAIIKEQLTKLSQKKPKKSILKETMSTSLFKESKKKNYSEKLQENEANLEEVEEKDENVEIKHSATKLSKVNDEIEFIKKKKCKSVSFGDNVEYDDVD